MVNFYAPWSCLSTPVFPSLSLHSLHPSLSPHRCGHCKALAPHYSLLGDTYLEEDDIVIAHIDGPENPEIMREFLVNGFPTILFFPKGNNNPFPYEQDKSIEAMTAWINERLGVERHVPLPQSSVVELDKNNFGSFVEENPHGAVVLFYSRGVCPNGNCLVCPPILTRPLTALPFYVIRAWSTSSI
jgi:thiol-disulfide isomerase/thioredoxin